MRRINRVLLAGALISGAVVLVTAQAENGSKREAPAKTDEREAAHAFRVQVTEGSEAYVEGRYDDAYILLSGALAKTDDGTDVSAGDISKANYYLARARIAILREAVGHQDVEKLTRYQNAILDAYNELKRARAADSEGLWAERVDRVVQSLYVAFLQGGMTGLTELNRNPNENGEERAIILDQARAYLAAAAEIKPDFYASYDLLGQVEMHRNRPDLALARFQRAAKLYEEKPPRDPDLSALYLYSRIALLERHSNGDLEAAYDTLVKGLAVLEREVERFEEGGTGLKPGEPVLSDADRQEVERVHRGMLTLLLDIVLKDPNRREEALERFAAAIESHPDDYKLHIGYAKLLEGSDPDGAIGTYRRAIEIDSARNIAWFNLGAFYINLAKRKYDQARQTSDPEEIDTLRAPPHAHQFSRVPLVCSRFRLGR